MQCNNARPMHAIDALFTSAVAVLASAFIHSFIHLHLHWLKHILQLQMI